MYGGLHVKYRYSCHILIKQTLLDKFSKNPQTSNFMKIRPVGAELFHANGRADGQTDVTKLIVAFRSVRKIVKGEY
jgi:hypothetical protein